MILTVFYYLNFLNIESLIRFNNTVNTLVTFLKAFVYLINHRYPCFFYGVLLSNRGAATD